MADDVSVDIQGVLETQAEMERIIRDLRGDRFLNALRDCTLWVQTDAKINAPVDSGRLRASITPDVRTDGDTVMGVVGSNVTYAPYVETGTRPHWPPVGALETWARRHGTTAFVVARAIARRGTRAHRYMQRAAESNTGRIQTHLDSAVGEIVER